MSEPNTPAPGSVPAAVSTPATAPMPPRAPAGHASPFAPEAGPAGPVPMPVAPPPVPDRVVCPVCQTPFGPRGTGGRCPVCGEQVVPEEAVARVVPGLTPAWAWLKAGGWRIVLLLFFVVSQVALFFIVLHLFQDAHAL